VIDLRPLGWNGSRITIPICNKGGGFAFFKLAKDPEDKSDSPKMLASPGGHAELYGWERVLANPERIIICEGEFDRLVLESRGFAAVTSTAARSRFDLNGPKPFERSRVFTSASTTMMPGAWGLSESRG
jgi:hypothetical protein